MTKTILIVLTILVSNHVEAKQVSTKTLMQETFYSLSQLLPYMSTDLNFSNMAQHKKINNHLNTMVTAFKKGNHQKILHSPGLKPNYDSIIRNLDSAQMNFASGNKTFARLRLNDSTNLCVSCHTQLPESKKISSLINFEEIEKSLKGNKYQIANVYLILREYKRALSAYKEYLDSTLKKTTKKPIQEHYNKSLYDAFYKTIYITAKAYHSPSMTLEFLDSLNSKRPIPHYIQSEIQNWKSRAEYWKKMTPKLDKKDISIVQLNRIISYLEQNISSDDNTILSGDFDYDLMIISGIFSRKLMAENIKQKAKILYWLGIAEYRLGKYIFFNIGDIYLKECINENPKKKIATKCYQALENEVKFKYTGTSGENIPSAVLNELKLLKKQL